MSDILDRIARYKRDEVASRKAIHSLADLEARAREVSQPRGFRAALERAHRLAQRQQGLAQLAAPLARTSCASCKAAARAAERRGARRGVRRARSLLRRPPLPLPLRQAPRQPPPRRP